MCVLCVRAYETYVNLHTFIHLCAVCVVNTSLRIAVHVPVHEISINMMIVDVEAV